MNRQQIHKRLNEDQVIAIIENYMSQEICAKDAMDNLGLKKSQFFNLVSQYRNNTDTFSLKHKGNNGNRSISRNAEKRILNELEAEKELIENKNIPIKHYNYSAVKELLEDKYAVRVSLPTIINRAKKHGYCTKKPPKKVHDREVLTNLVGELVQHDSSWHQWSPYMHNKLYLITTLDDYSRLLLYADLVERENVWAHILALKSVFLRYGCPLKYYSDQHSIFRYVKDRDQHRPWHNYTKFTDDVDPQWKQVLNECKVTAVYALSPQAKGKIERPYGWIQDRIVRTAAKEKIDTLTGLRKTLQELVNRYNTKWVHSTTGEIPIIRFENAVRNNKTLFKQFMLLKTDQTIDDIFCLRMKRMVDSYRKVSVGGFELRVPNGMPKHTIDLKIIPDADKALVKIRFWQNNIFLGEILEKSVNLPIVRF